MIVIVCVVSCSKKETGCDDAYYYDDETNKAIFYLNNEYVSYDSESKKVKDTACKTYDFRSDFESGNYVKHNFISTASNFDTVELANCLYLDKLFISLIYNLRIVGDVWTVSIYFPSDNCDFIVWNKAPQPFKGTYKFRVGKSENNAFNGCLNELKDELKSNYYPFNNTDGYYMEPMPALYLRLINSREQTEYFASQFGVENRIIENKLSVFGQIIDVILIRHLLLENSSEKICDDITLLDIRDRFNSFLGKDSFTGFLIEDFDSILPPPEPTDNK
ncbi:MAG: hypothetical protein IKQ94_05035 [Bacteroidales bacterium]|nr:hypothetical protein [Bacteroidales bacterium]